MYPVLQVRTYHTDGPPWDREAFRVNNYTWSIYTYSDPKLVLRQRE